VAEIQEKKANSCGVPRFPQSAQHRLRDQPQSMSQNGDEAGSNCLNLKGAIPDTSALAG
jgi:hypothetical protein